MTDAAPRTRRPVRRRHLVLVAAALVLVLVGIALQGLVVGVAAVVPLALASYLGQRPDDDMRPLRR